MKIYTIIIVSCLLLSACDTVDPASPYLGRRFFSAPELIADSDFLQVGDSVTIECSIDTSEFDMVGRWIILSSDSLQFDSPDVNLYPQGVFSVDSLTRNPLARHGSFKYRAYPTVRYVFPPVAISKRNSVSLRARATVPTNTMSDSIRLVAVFQIDSVNVDVDSLTHGRTFIHVIATRWYDLNFVPDLQIFTMFFLVGSGFLEPFPDSESYPVYIRVIK